MGFEQLAALRDQLAAEAAKNKRPARKPSAKNDKQARPTANDKPAQGQAPRNKPRREPQPQVEPVVLNISRLQRQYPKAFPKRPDPKVPLKLGIHTDLYAQTEELGLTQPEIKEAIQTWCQGSRYWACLTIDANRIDLSGEVVGTVTEAEAKRAKQLASRQRWQARNKQKKALAQDGASESQDGLDTADKQVTAPPASLEPTPESSASDQTSVIVENSASTPNAQETQEQDNNAPSAD